MHPSVKPLHEILTLNTRLFSSCLDGLDAEQAAARLGGSTNNVVFIAAHLLDARCYLARYLGLEITYPFEEEWRRVKSVEDLTDPPELAAILAAWKRVSDALAERFGSLTEADLEAESEQKFPVADGTVLGGATFLLQHDSYHLGQLGLLRKHWTSESMSYE